jgi:hypothetical protein
VGTVADKPAGCASNYKPMIDIVQEGMCWFSDLTYRFTRFIEALANPARVPGRAYRNWA